MQGHNPVCAGGPNVPASVTSDITVAGVAAELAAAGIQVLAIDVGALDSTSTNVWGGCAGPETQPPQATTLASATGGSYTSGEGPAMRTIPMRYSLGGMACLLHGWRVPSSSQCRIAAERTSLVLLCSGAGVSSSTIVDTIIAAVKEASCPSSSDRSFSVSASTAGVMPPAN